MIPASLSEVASHLKFIRETGGQNAGFWVNFCQRIGGDGVEGDSWCSDFVSLVENIAYKGRTVSPRTGSCQTKLDYCRKKGWIVQNPQLDDLCFSINASGHAHHVGIVTSSVPLATIAGNTSEDGTSDNGTGVFEHLVSPGNKVFARLPKVI